MHVFVNFAPVVRSASSTLTSLTGSTSNAWLTELPPIRRPRSTTTLLASLFLFPSASTIPLVSVADVPPD
uniref:Secreted protein n=1 Tax=Steinernema glaseri TaxID=37863 RepID=A0A1I8AHS4_9BILA